MEAGMIHRKGIFSFLAITFGITYAIEIGLIAAGVRFDGAVPVLWAQLVIAGVMWVPAAAALITTRFITKEKLSTTGLRFGSWKPYVVTAFLIPTLFILVYLLTWGLGLGQPDWQMNVFLSQMAATGADMTRMRSPELMYAGLFLVSLFGAIWVNSLFGLGEEWGWRGYLLPRLMPLGKVKAYLLLGVIWGLWHAPLIFVGFNYPGYPLLGVLMMIGLTLAIGIYMNELTLRYRSAILAGWIHGVFNSQGYGIWRILFPGVNPLLGGFSGLVGLAVFALAGLGTFLFLNRRDEVKLVAAVD
jgi:uncharacterized protein